MPLNRLKDRIVIGKSVEARASRSGILRTPLAYCWLKSDLDLYPVKYTY